VVPIDAVEQSRTVHQTPGLNLTDLLPEQITTEETQIAFRAELLQLSRYQNRIFFACFLAFYG
jgi:hypothetical protein